MHEKRRLKDEGKVRKRQNELRWGEKKGLRAGDDSSPLQNRTPFQVNTTPCSTSVRLQRRRLGQRRRLRRVKKTKEKRGRVSSLYGRISEKIKRKKTRVLEIPSTQLSKATR